MKQYLKHYINGDWVESIGQDTIEVFNPATEKAIGLISSGTEEDLNKAVEAARHAFPSFSQTTREERIDLLERIAKEYERRKEDIIDSVTEELGCPRNRSEKVHYNMGLTHFKQAAESLKDFTFEEKRENSTVVKDSIGVSGLITPWNFPTNQTSIKIAGALAAGSPMILKPASMTPYTAMILAEIFDEAGVPKGVFNLVNGSGKTIGNAMSSHPDIDLISFTGSTAVGEEIMKRAATTIKKVTLELGGKSPLIVLDDADVKEASDIAVSNIMNNTGQVCTAATRILIPRHMKETFEKELLNTLPQYSVGDPQNDVFTGPLVAEKIWDRVQFYIQKGIDEGAKLLTGGLNKPEGLETGYYVKPTIFTEVKNDMTIAQEEIFGPVMSVIYYDTLEEAINIANDTTYGLAGYVVGKDQATLNHVARSIQAGRIHVNRGKSDYSAPFGGFKRSGIGREWGDYGIEEYLEPKTIVGLE